MDHDWVAIGMGVVAVALSVLSIVYSIRAKRYWLLAEERSKRNRS